jgi:glycosyl transferase family 25
MSIPSFVISLEHDTERRRHMQHLLGEIGMAAEFVAAVDGRKLTPDDLDAYDAKRCLRVYGVEMIPSELGCYLSHYRLYQRMVSEGIETALIMEDDLQLDPCLPRLIDQLVALRGIDWLVIRLMSSRGRLADPDAMKRQGHAVAALDCGRTLYRLRTHVLGACAYLITRQGAARMVEYGRHIFMPIDHTMDRFWENGIVPYVVSPFLVTITELPSRIGARMPDRHRDQPLSVRIGRRLQRASDGLRKRAFNLVH